MCVRKIISTAVCLAAVTTSIMPAVSASSGAVSSSPNYTVSGYTATANDGVYQMKSSVGVGTMNVDLKNGTLEFDKVSVTSSVPFSTKVSQPTVTYDAGSNAMSADQIGPTLNSAFTSYFNSIYWSSDDLEYTLANYFNAEVIRDDYAVCRGSLGIFYRPIESVGIGKINTIALNATDFTSSSQRFGDYKTLDSEYAWSLFATPHFDIYNDSKWYNIYAIPNKSGGFGKKTASYQVYSAAPFYESYDSTLIFMPNRTPRILISSGVKQYNYATLAIAPKASSWSALDAGVWLTHSHSLSQTLSLETQDAISTGTYEKTYNIDLQLYKTTGKYTGTYTQYTTLPISGAKAIPSGVQSSRYRHRNSVLYTTPHQ